MSKFLLLDVSIHTPPLPLSCSGLGKQIVSTVNKAGRCPSTLIKDICSRSMFGMQHAHHLPKDIVVAVCHPWLVL